MKLVQVVFLLTAVAALCVAQQAPNVLINTSGVSAPNPGNCAGTQDTYKTYTQDSDPARAFSGMWICVQSTAHDFGWAAVAMLPPNTTGVSGTRLVYNAFCGTTVGNAACSNYTNTGQVRTISGIAQLVSNAAVISGISPAFTGTATYACTAVDQTTRANVVNVANTSASSITITGTGGASDVITYLCNGY